MSASEMPEERAGFVIVKLKKTFAYLSKKDFAAGGWERYTAEKAEVKAEAEPVVPVEVAEAEVKPDVANSGGRKRTK